MNIRRNILVVSLVVFFLTGCINPVKDSPTSTYSVELSEENDKDVDRKQTKGYVTFWFDDGLLSTYEIAYPELSKRNWKGTVAIISDREIAQEKFVPDGDPVMSWDQVKELYNSGWEVSSHTQTHSRLNKTEDQNTLQKEIIGSKQDLEEMGFVVPSFTFPYGQNGLNKGQEMISNNYLYWRSSHQEINPVPAWRHITSIIISEEVERDDLEKWVKETEENNGWLVITLHNIVDNPANIWQHTKDQFNMLLDVVENSSLEVVLPNDMYQTFGYAEGRTPTLLTSEIADLSTIGKDSFEEEVHLSIPSLEIDSKLELVCGEKDQYDFSILHEAPIWICPEASPYLADIGDYGASVVLGHRQWGPVPKIFAELDSLQEGNTVTIRTTQTVLDFSVVQKIEIYPENLWEEIAQYYVQGTEENRSFLILITCTPYGTAWERLLIILERNDYEYETPVISNNPSS